MPVTRTNTKRYVAFCDFVDHEGVQCDWRTEVVSLRLVGAQRLRQHQLTKGHKTMKSATPDLPAVEQGENLSDYKDHLVVIESGWTVQAGTDTQYGKSDPVKCKAWAFVSDGNASGWKFLGDDVLIFQKTLKRQLEDAGTADDFGGRLTQGTKREGQRANPNEWFIAPPTKDEQKLLDKWTPTADSF